MITAVLLAAGRGQRFGGAHKLLAPMPWRGRQVPLVRLAAEQLVCDAVDELVVVLGRDGDRVREALTGIGARFVVNEDYVEGMSTSVRAGVQAAQTAERLNGVLVALGDQPLLAGDVVRSVVDAFSEVAVADRRGAIVVPRYGGVDGHPVLFGGGVLDELLRVTGDRGARSVVERTPGRVRYVDLDVPAPIDVDTPDDLRLLIARAGGGDAA